MCKTLTCKCEAQAVTVKPFEKGQAVVCGIDDMPGTVEQCFDGVGGWRVIIKVAPERANPKGLRDFPASAVRALSSPPAPASGGVSVTELLPERAPLQVAYDLRDSLNSWPGPHNLTDAQRFADRVWYAARKALTAALTHPAGEE